MTTVGDYVTNTNCRYTGSQNPIILFEWDMIDLWHMVVQIAKFTDADGTGQDRFVSQGSVNRKSRATLVIRLPVYIASITLN
jgi:hypothetical protein